MTEYKQPSEAHPFWRQATTASQDNAGYLVERLETSNRKRIDVLVNYEPGDLYIPLRDLRTLPGYFDMFNLKSGA